MPLSRFPCVEWSSAGGVLSPILFTIYMDELLKLLKSLGIGCQWDGYFAGAVCADDVALLAPSLSAGALMLHYCEDFAVSCGLTFNSSKPSLSVLAPSPLSPDLSPFASQALFFLFVMLLCILVITDVMTS